MRIAVVISLLLVVMLLGGLLLLPQLVSWEDYRDEVTEQAQAITGQSVAIAGAIELELLPRPILSLAQASLSGRANAPDGHALEVDRLDLRLKPLPLLRGEVEVEEVQLVRPVLELDRIDQPAAASAALALAGRGFVLPLGAGGPRHLSVIDGRAVVNRGEGAGRHHIEAINLDLSAAGPNGPYVLDGDFVIAEEPFAVTASLGQIAPEAWSALQLEITAPGASSAPARLSFRGLAWSDPAAPRLRGDLVLTGSDARAGLNALGRALGNQLPELPPWLATGFRLSGQLEFQEQWADLADLHLALARAEAAGRLRLGLGPNPEIDLQLALGHLAAPDAWPLAGDDGSLAALAALSAGLAGQIDLSLQTLAYRGGTIRQLRTRLALSGTGETIVEQARATLPGQTTLGFTGALAGAGEDAALEGALTLVTNDLRAALDWLDLAPTAVAQGRLRSMSLASQLALRDGTLRFSDAELRVDASRVEGSLALSVGPRPQIAGALELDRLNLDAYWPEGEAQALIAGAVEALRSIDVAMETRIGRFNWQGLRLEEVALSGRSVAGQLTVTELSLRDGSDGEAHLNGTFDLERQTFDLAAALATARPAQLLRRLGMAPPLMLARLGPVRATSAARGDLEAFELELELRHEDARLELAGEVERSNGPATYDLAVDASHPDYPELLDRLGVPRAPGDSQAQAFAMTGRLSGGLAGEAAFVGSVQLGAMSVTGRVGWHGTPRPRLVARISAGEPQAEALADLVALAGLRLDPDLLDGPGWGPWSAQPLGLGWLAAFDAELELSAKGGAVGSGLEAALRLDRGRLMVDRLSAALWDGRLEAQASFDVERQLPFLALALDLRAIDPTALAAWLDLPPVVAGPTDLYLEATTAGNSPRDLIGGVIGEGKLTLQDGRLIGEDLAALRLLPAPPASTLTGDQDQDADAVPVADLGGRFGIRRGIASIEAMPFVLDGVQARLEGTVDLLLWAADLTIRLDDRELALRLVGPLERPQIRLLEPSGRIVPAQAP